MHTDPANLDSQPYRAQTWDAEYSIKRNLPSTRADKPSKIVARLTEIVPDAVRGNVLDAGVGNARNLVFLLNNGAERATGIDFSGEAIKLANKRVEIEGLKDRVKILHQSVADELQEPDESFDLIIDMMTLHTLSKEDREKYIEQAIRLLKPGGHLVLYTMAYNDDEGDEAKRLIEEWEGPEKGRSYRFKVDDDVITERVFTKAELEAFFAPLQIVFFEEEKFKTHAFGGVYPRSYYSAVFRKPE